VEVVEWLKFTSGQNQNASAVARHLVRN